MSKIKMKKKTDNKDKIKTTSERLVYCGPSVGFKVSKDTVYIGGIPKSLDEEINDCKEIKNLFVPLQSYTETKKKIKEEGTIENLSYKAVKLYIKDKRGDR